MPRYTVHAENGIVDPLSEIRDPRNPRYVDSSAAPIAHFRAKGSKTRTIVIPKSTKLVRVYLACTPSTTFDIRVQKEFKGGCSRQFQNWADIPTEPGATKLEVTVPSKTEYIALVIPDPKEN